MDMMQSFHGSTGEKVKINQLNLNGSFSVYMKELLCTEKQNDATEILPKVGIQRSRIQGNETFQNFEVDNLL